MKLLLLLSLDDSVLKLSKKRRKMTRSNRRAMFRNGQMMVFVRKRKRIAQSTHLLTNQLMFSLVFDKSAGSFFVGFGLSRKDHSHHDGYIIMRALQKRTI